jgi:hypothetical protein
MHTPIWQQQCVVTELTAQAVLYKPLAINYDTVVLFFLSAAWILMKQCYPYLMNLFSEHLQEICYDW